MSCIKYERGISNIELIAHSIIMCTIFIFFFVLEYYSVIEMVALMMISVSILMFAKIVERFVKIRTIMNSENDRGRNIITMNFIGDSGSQVGKIIKSTTLFVKKIHYLEGNITIITLKNSIVKEIKIKKLSDEFIDDSCKIEDLVSKIVGFDDFREYIIFYSDPVPCYSEMYQQMNIITFENGIRTKLVTCSIYGNILGFLIGKKRGLMVEHFGFEGNVPSFSDCSRFVLYQLGQKIKRNQVLSVRDHNINLYRKAMGISIDTNDDPKKSQ